MLDDRSYMRDEGPQHRFSATTILMFVLGACYALQIAGYYSGWSRFIDNHLALSTDGIRHFEVWQLVTYQFLHGGPGHILFNLLALWSFGKWVENLFGRNGLYAFFLLSGIAGGIAHAVAGGFMDRWSGPVVGASAGTMGLLAACCIMEPDGTLLLYFIPIRARYALIGTLGLSLFFTLVPENVTGVAHTAHLGGRVAGLAFMRYGLP
ncbi:MAG: rhomboid family intramembrane serine protease, partial [Verrucomicrobia bacterium]|nr:rhomboid family intramembrane serine protease [Verrucomicrobiota bacterium]